MSAIVLQQVRENGRTTRTKVLPGLRGIQVGDRFIVRWRDPRGKQTQKRIPGDGRPAKKLADSLAAKVTSELTLGTYESNDRKTWSYCRDLFTQSHLDELSSGSQPLYRIALDLFERICSPSMMSEVDSRLIDSYRSALRKMRGQKKGSKQSPATTNRHLRHLKVFLRYCCERDFLAKMPIIKMVREPEKLPVYMLPGDFDKIYQSCETAIYPQDRPYPPPVIGGGD